jgi:hypothetical protein
MAEQKLTQILIEETPEGQTRIKVDNAYSREQVIWLLSSAIQTVIQPEKEEAETDAVQELPDTDQE